MSALRWYFPWSELDWILRAELLLWLLAVALAVLVWWLAVVKGRPWLKLQHMKGPRPPSEQGRRS